VIQIVATATTKQTIARMSCILYLAAHHQRIQAAPATAAEPGMKSRRCMSLSQDHASKGNQ
jgi:hypothetical protein